MNKSTKVTLYALWQLNSYTVTFDKNYLENNLLPNAIEPSSWTFYLTSPSSKVNMENENALNGKNLVFTMTAGSAGPIILCPLEAGKTYTWSMYIKSDRTIDRLDIGHEQSGMLRAVTVTNEWQRITKTFTVDTNAGNGVFDIYRWNGGWTAGDKIYIHSLEMAKTNSLNTTAVQKTYNSTLGTLETPVRSGYTFLGWYTSPVGGTRITSTTKVTGNVVYYAHWKCNTYSVTFDKNYLENDLYSHTYEIGYYDTLYGTDNVKIKSSQILANEEAMQGKVLEITHTSGNAGTWFGQWADGPLTTGETYTWSVCIKASRNKTIMLGHEQSGRFSANITTAWQRFTHTFVATQNDQHFAFLFGIYADRHVE